MKGKIPIKLLLVENDDIHAIALSDILLQNGFSVDVTHSPDDVIVKTDIESYDLCITGERLLDLSDDRDQSGIDLVKSLAKRSETLKFIVISDFMSFESVKTLLSPDNNLHVVDYISQHEDVESILESIRKAYEFPYAKRPSDRLIYPVEQTINVVNTKIANHFRNDPELIRNIDPFLFEQVVAELFEAEGYKVLLTPHRSDGGKDIYVYKTDPFTRTQFLVECKRYVPPSKVGVEIVRQLFGVVQQENASGGIIITTSYFTKPAKDFANIVPYQLFLRDFDYLSQWLRKKQ